MKAIAQSRTLSLPVIEMRSSNNSIKNPSILSVSICGSYHRHLRKMHKLIKECKKLGIEVHIPRYPVKKSSTNGFVFLKGEKGTPKQLQEKNFDAIARSSFVLVVNTNGYIGPSTAMEIGYAIAKGVPIFCTDKPEDYIFQLYTEYGKTLPEIVKILNRS
jgi:nucleoside 2-deoxyribosyltransferase